MNPVDRVAIHRLALLKGGEDNSEELVCPICHSDFEKSRGYFVCRQCHRVYFSYENIPILDPANSHLVGHFLHES